MENAVTWAEAFKIQPEKLAEWSSAAPAGKPLLVWCLEQGHIAPADYLAWASDNYGLAVLSGAFFEQGLDRNYFALERRKEIWSPWNFPVNEWDGTTFIACVEPPPPEERAPQTCYVLADPRALAEVWEMTGTGAHSIEAPPPMNPAEPDVPAGFSSQVKPFKLNLDGATLMSEPDLKLEDADPEPEHEEVDKASEPTRVYQVPPPKAPPAPPAAAPKSASPPMTGVKPPQKPMVKPPDNPAARPIDQAAPKPAAKLADKMTVKPAADTSTQTAMRSAEATVIAPMPKPAPEPIETDDNEPVGPPIRFGAIKDDDGPTTTNFESGPPTTIYKIPIAGAALNLPSDEAKALDIVFKQIGHSYAHSGVVRFEADGHARIYKWAPSLNPPNDGQQAALNLAFPSFLRIVSRTQMPYHGYLVDSPPHREFFEGLGLAQLPACVTAVPIKINAQLWGVVLAIGSETLQDLEHLSKVASATEQLIKAVGSQWVKTKAS